MGTLMPDQYGYGATEPYLLITSSFVVSGIPKIYLVRHIQIGNN